MPNLITTKPGKKYRSLRKPKVYEALRRQGMSKQSAARISNAQAHKAFTLDQLEAFVSSPHYDVHTADAIASHIPALPRLKGEQISPGVTRIHGNLCNVHGRYGPCDAALSGKKKPLKPRKGRKPPKPKQTPEQHAAQRAQQRQTNIDAVAKRMAGTDTGLAPGGVKALTAFAQGEQPNDVMGKGMAKMGLAEQAADGSYRMTPTGRAVVSAMAAGDYQRAVDGISRGTDASSARQGRTAAHTARQQASQAAHATAATARQARADAAAKKRAEAARKPAKAGASGGKKPAAQATERPRAATPAKRPSRSALPSAPALSNAAPAAAPKPKPAAAPPKAPAKQLPPVLQDAADQLSEGAELADDDVQALIRNGLAKLNKDGELVLTAAGMRATMKASPAHTGVMVALYPDPAAAKQIVTQKGVTEPIDQLHLTLAFLGDSTETALATNKDKLIAAVKQWATQKGKSLEGTMNGLGRFFHSEDDDTNAVFVSPDVPGLPELRQSLVAWIEQSGFDYAQNHGFTPHITVAYVPLDAPTPPIRVESPIAFNQVTLAWGDERYDYPLGVVTKDTSFRVFKDATGRHRWVAQSSTAFQDRDKEIVSTKALADDCRWADMHDNAYGPLRWWHTPGLDLGDCDFNAMHGRVLIESGTFRSATIAQKVARAAGDLEISLGFIHLPSEPDADGVFHHIRRFERSLVPRGKASNRFTAFRVKEKPRMDTAKVEYLKTELKFSDEEVNAVLATAAATEKAATDQGVAYKADEPALPDVVINGVIYKAFPPAADDTATMPGNAEEDALDGGADDAMEEPVDENALTLSTGDLAAIGEAISSGIAQVMGALDLEKKVAGHVQGLMAPYQATKDASDAEKAEQIKALQTALKDTQAKLSELTGDQPAAPYRASAARDNVLTDATMLAAAKQLADPTGVDPWADIKQGLGLARPHP